MVFFMVLMHLRYPEVESDSFICFLSLGRSSHSASISSVIHDLFAFPFPYNFCCCVTHCCVESIGKIVHIYICIRVIDQLMEFSS